jgi:general secretion pathway protein G
LAELLLLLRKDRRGLTLLEMLIAMVILSILAGAVLPLAEISVKRTKEMELKRSLRLIRTAIDDYHADCVEAKKQGSIPLDSPNADSQDPCYPEELQDLLKATDWGTAVPYKKKYLRRIPPDPFAPEGEEWGLRSYTDDPDSTVWGGENVYDVYSQSDGTAIDGTPYNTW